MDQKNDKNINHPGAANAASGVNHNKDPQLQQQQNSEEMFREQVSGSNPNNQSSSNIQEAAKSLKSQDAKQIKETKETAEVKSTSSLKEGENTENPESDKSDFKNSINEKIYDLNWYKKFCSYKKSNYALYLLLKPAVYGNSGEVITFSVPKSKHIKEEKKITEPQNKINSEEISENKKSTQLNNDDIKKKKKHRNKKRGSKSEYNVGYGKPPKEHQFKKGQSGNPNGRPKKLKADTLFEQMALNLTDTVNTSYGEMSKLELLATSTIKDAIQKDGNSRKLIFNKFLKYNFYDEIRRMMQKEGLTTEQDKKAEENRNIIIELYRLIKNEKGQITQSQLKVPATPREVTEIKKWINDLYKNVEKDKSEKMQQETETRKFNGTDPMV